MKQTVNFNLPILEEGDMYLIDTQNNAFIKIDLELKGIIDKMLDLENRVRRIEGDM